MELPEEIVYDIFSRLPTKSILKFKSCTKSINRFTKDNKFIVKHGQNLTLQGGDSSFFIQGGYGYEIKIYALPGNKAVSSSSSSSHIIPKKFLQFLNKRFGKILLSSNGLLLCEFEQKRGLLDHQEFIICNPTTMKFSSFVAPRSLVLNYPQPFITMAFDQNHNQYQLLLFEYSRQEGSENVVCKTYMSEEGVWKEREKGLHMGCSWAMLCPHFKGRFHYMLSYNFEDGKIRRVHFPKEATKSLAKVHYHDLCTFKRDKVGSSIGEIYLVIFDRGNRVFNFWVLKDHQSSSWSMFLTLRFQDLGLEKDSIIHGFTVINGNTLVFATRRDVYEYNLIGERGNKAERIGVHNYKCRLSFFSYSSTLYSCGANAKAFLL